MDRERVYGRGHALRIAVGITMLVLLVAGGAGSVSGGTLTSQFLRNDPCTEQIMAGTPYNMDDPTWITDTFDQNKSICAYKFFSAFHMLGYETRFYDDLGKDHLYSLHKFQNQNGIPVTNYMTSEAITKLDTLLTLREQKIAPMAQNFILYNHMQPLHYNEISKDSLAYIYTLPMAVLPQYLQITTEYEMVQCEFGQCMGDIQDANGNPWPTYPVDINQDYRFFGGFGPKVSYSNLNSAAVYVQTVLHEYAHYLDYVRNPSSRPGQPHENIINRSDFDNISYDMTNVPPNLCVDRRSNNPKDWISKYGFDPGYYGCPEGKSMGTEEFADSFAYYPSSPDSNQYPYQ